MALHASGVETAVTKFCWLFHANAAISVHHVIRSGWWNSGNICVKKCSRPFPTVISSLAYQRSSGDISYDRSLLSDLSRCSWESLKLFFQESVPEKGAVPGAVIAIQSFGDFLGFNSHLHVLCSDGCFYGHGMFRVAPRFHTKDLEEIFRHKVFKMLLSKGKITQDLVNMLMSWRHSGFNVFCGPRIQPREQEAMENLARYIMQTTQGMIEI